VGTEMAGGKGEAAFAVFILTLKRKLKLSL
jgi:hypothetical protein